MKKILIFIFLISLISTASAGIVSSSVSDYTMYKCQNVSISASFDDTNITSVNATLSSVKAVQPMIPGSGRVTPETQSTIISMTNNSTHWNAWFGNDPNLLWGNRTIIFNVNNSTQINNYIDSRQIRIYSDICTATVSNYTQIIHPMGNYTSMLYNDSISITDWVQYPWIQYWGYGFYILVMFTISISIYFKTQTITQPLTVSFVILLIISNVNEYVPYEYRSVLTVLEALAFGVILYKVFTRD